MAIKLRNRDWVFVIMRADFDGNHVVISVAPTYERADELKGEYEQIFHDKGVSPDESYFYVVQTLIYE